MATVPDTGAGVNCGCSADGHGQRIYRCRLHESAPRLLLALKQVAAQQQRTVDWIRTHNVVFDGDGGKWEKVAFSIYTDLVVVTSLSEEAIKEASDA